MVKRLIKRTARVGIFGVGLNVYWKQFDGLLETLMQYHEVLKGIIERNGVDVIDFGMVDSSERSYAALEKMKGAGLDVLFVNMLTYATSSVFAPIVRDIDVPVVMAALQPREHMDYETASTRQQLENDNICSVPEFTGVAIRMGKRVNDVIIGTLYNDPEAEKEIACWCDIAKVLHDLKGARFGLIGHVLEAMYDMHAILPPCRQPLAFMFHCWK